MSQTLIDRARTYIDRNGGARAFAGLAALAAIGLVFLVGLAGEKIAERSIAVAALKAEVVALESLGSVDEIDDRITAYRQALATYESRVIEAQTAGLVSAELQSIMRASAQKANLNNVQVEVNVNDELSTEELIVFRVDVRAVERDDGAFASFMADVISGKTAFYVSTVGWDRQSGRVSISFECVGRITEPRT